MESFEKDNQTGINHFGNRANLPLANLTVSSVLGDKVYNPAGEHLGNIRDIMLNVIEGRIEYVVVEFGGFLGLNQKYLAVPFGKFTIDAARQAFILDQDKEALQSLPGFDKDHWPQTNSHRSSSSTGYGSFMGANTGSEY